MFAASGCLVADPPEYKPPAQTPPLLDLVLADPPLREVLPMPFDETILFNVPVRSEDAGDDLMAAVHLDWGFPSQRWQKNRRVPASTFDDDTRVITFDLTLARTADLHGCHQLTLLVSHFLNFDFINQVPLDSDDQAIATWWINVDPDETDPTTLEKCQTISAPGGTE